MTADSDKLYVITGPTASGKTSKAVALARAIDAEIISADSRQVYRGMDIGTGKDLEDYGDVPYHLIDICDMAIFWITHFAYAVFTKFFRQVRCL